MPWVNNWQAFIGLFRRLSYTSMIDSMKDLHWDIRPSPRFGTVEVRVMDTPLTITRAVNIAGFIQIIACWLLTERPFKHQPEDYLLYPFNRYRACRYGLDGIKTDVNSGEQQTFREEILQLADKLAPSAHKLNAGSALEAVVRREAGKQRAAADARVYRQRRIVNRAGAKALRDLDGVAAIKAILHALVGCLEPCRALAIASAAVAVISARLRQRDMLADRPVPDAAKLYRRSAARTHRDVLAE